MLFFRSFFFWSVLKVANNFVLHVNGSCDVHGLRTTTVRDVTVMYCKCNRRGIVSLSSGSEKPSLSVEELLENRRRGMSYASIGRKLGIDPSKDEVLNIYHAIKEAGTVHGECAIIPAGHFTPKRHNYCHMIRA